MDSAAFVLVKNTGTADFSGRYDGENYDIPSKGQLTMSAAAASHLFGYALEGDKAAVRAELLSIALRHGWQVSGQGRNEVAEQAMLKRFKDFVISPCKLTAANGEGKAAGESA